MCHFLSIGSTKKAMMRGRKLVLIPADGIGKEGNDERNRACATNLLMGSTKKAMMRGDRACAKNLLIFYNRINKEGNDKGEQSRCHNLL
jgi:hypothetical protein